MMGECCGTQQQGAYTSSECALRTHVSSVHTDAAAHVLHARHLHEFTSN